MTYVWLPGEVAVLQHRSPAPGPRIDPLRHRRVQALHPVPERHLVVGFDQEVEVVALEGPPGDAEPFERAALRHAASHRMEDMFAPQIRNVVEHTHRYVDRR